MLYSRKGLTGVEYRPLVDLFRLETAGKPQKSPKKAVRMGKYLKEVS
jgi:hypothetical protein